MRIAATGFVSAQAGSVASANALLLRGLLDRGCAVDFFSKASFVDPRPLIGAHPAFRFFDVDNRLADRIRAGMERVPLAGKLAALADAATYNKLLVQTMNSVHAQSRFDLALWLGDYAAGPVEGIPTVSFAQGPPGTDARSLISRFSEVSALAGSAAAWKWRAMAEFRLSRFGLPDFRPSDRIIVGSSQSRSTLEDRYGIAEERIKVLPYPIDLEQFRLPGGRETSASLRVLWVGRIIPRKRLDLFLNAAATAIGGGTDLALSIVGSAGFVPGYEKLIREFPYPDRMRWEPFVPREEIPSVMHRHDVLVQPSEEENFGSSVAEAQACGLPVIVGATNGNADFLCPRDIHLADSRPETLAAAFAELARRKAEDRLGDPKESRECAGKNFSPAVVMDGLLEILREAAASAKT